MSCSQCGYEGILTTSLCMTCFEKVKQEGRVEGAKEIVDLIVKQQKVYRNNLDKGESKWLEGAVDCCNYLLQLIKEKRLLELEKGEIVNE